MLGAITLGQLGELLLGLDEGDAQILHLGVVGDLGQGSQRRRIAAVLLNGLEFGLRRQPPLAGIRVLVGDDAELFGLQTIYAAKRQQIIAGKKIAELLFLLLQTGLYLHQPALVPVRCRGVGIDPLLHIEIDVGLCHLIGDAGGQLGRAGFEPDADQLGIAHRRDGQVSGQILQRMLVA